MTFNATANRQIDDNVKTDLILKEGADVIPKQVMPSIQPVYEVYRRISNVAEGGSQTTTGAFTIMTTPSDRDFFLTSASLSVIKNAACDVSSGAINLTATVGTAAFEILTIAVLTLTAQENTISVNFPNPVKVERNTAVQVSGTFTAGAMIRAATITGYNNSPQQPPFLLTS